MGWTGQGEMVRRCEKEENRGCEEMGAREGE